MVAMQKDDPHDAPSNGRTWCCIGQGTLKNANSLSLFMDVFTSAGCSDLWAPSGNESQQETTHGCDRTKWDKDSSEGEAKDKSTACRLFIAPLSCPIFVGLNLHPPGATTVLRSLQYTRAAKSFYLIQARTYHLN
jgi:hypothetical protein